MYHVMYHLELNTIIYIYTWRFPKIWVPLYIIHFHRIFHEINQPSRAPFFVASVQAPPPQGPPAQAPPAAPPAQAPPPAPLPRPQAPSLGKTSGTQKKWWLTLIIMDSRCLNNGGWQMFYNYYKYHPLLIKNYGLFNGLSIMEIFIIVDDYLIITIHNMDYQKKKRDMMKSAVINAWLKAFETICHGKNHHV